jgi:hypothetical protein
MDILLFPTNERLQLDSAQTQRVSFGDPNFMPEKIANSLPNWLRIADDAYLIKILTHNLYLRLFGLNH